VGVGTAAGTGHRRRWALRAGQIATPTGALLTVTGADTAPVAVVITDTVPSSLVTYAVPAHPPAAAAPGVAEGLTTPDDDNPRVAVDDG